MQFPHSELDKNASRTIICRGCKRSYCYLCLVNFGQPKARFAEYICDDCWEFTTSSEEDEQSSSDTER